LLKIKGTKVFYGGRLKVLKQ